jgi:phospholipase/carboxylesterase
MRLSFIFIFVAFSFLMSCQAQAPATDPGLEYLVREAQNNQEQPPLLIMIHGLGSNKEDLFALTKFIPSGFTVVSVEAPNAYGNGFAWYGMDFSGSEPLGDEAEAELSRKKLIQFIDFMVQKFDANPQKVFLMGFSQGAIMSFAIGLSEPNKIAGFAAFSGRVMQSSRENPLPKNRYQHLKVYLAHGKADRVLKYDYAIDAKALLDQLEIQTTFKSYPDGHTISRENLNDFLLWLKSIN